LKHLALIIPSHIQLCAHRWKFIAINSSPSQGRKNCYQVSSKFKIKTNLHSQNYYLGFLIFLKQILDCNNMWFDTKFVFMVYLFYIFIYNYYLFHISISCHLQIKLDFSSLPFLFYFCFIGPPLHLFKKYLANKLNWRLPYQYYQYFKYIIKFSNYAFDIVWIYNRILNYNIFTFPPYNGTFCTIIVS